jgi:hypothetical protein
MALPLALHGRLQSLWAFSLIRLRFLPPAAFASRQPRVRKSKFPPLLAARVFASAVVHVRFRGSTHRHAAEYSVMAVVFMMGAVKRP